MVPKNESMSMMMMTLINHSIDEEFSKTEKKGV